MVSISEVTELITPLLVDGRELLNFLHVIFATIFDVWLYIALFITTIYLSITFYMFFIHKKQPYKYVNDEKKFPTVTIQIPTYNELAALNCAQRCLDFDYPKDKYTIFIGDDSNKPEISKKLAAFAKKHKNVTVYKRKENVGFKPGNLNNMLKHTKTDYITIFDSDYLPQKDFLRKLVSPAIKDPSLAGVQAKWKISNPHQNLTTLLGTGIINTFHEVMLPFIKLFSPTITFCGSAELVHVKTLKELGGWRAGALTEDIDYSFRCINAGKNIYYLHDLECDNEVPQVSKDLFKQQMRWGYGVIRSFILHGKTLFFGKVGFEKKIMALLFGSGYIMTSLIMFLTVFGTLGIITHPPEAINLGRFALETAANILLSCGLLVTTIAASYSRQLGIKGVIQMIFASFTIGFVQVWYVNKGIYKAITGQPMQWFMLKKTGNEQKL